MIQVLFISGSRRRESFNSRLLTYLMEILGERCAAAIHRRFAVCQAMVVATPEYNGQPTAYLKNLVDWISRLSHARALFAYVGCVVMPDSVNVPYADQAWTGSGFAFDPDFDAQACAGAERFLHLAEACVNLAHKKEPA